MMNAGKYNKEITIYAIVEKEDKEGFKTRSKASVLRTYADVKTTRGFTLIANNTDFEKAYTRFTIRFPKTQITRDMLIAYGGKDYTIEYLNNVDEKGIELEIQAKEVTK